MPSFRCLLLPLLLLAASSGAAGEYFLDGAQRTELLLDGQITGRDGARYDIWIVPGYRYPVRAARSGWGKAGDALANYADPQHYRDMGRTTREVVRFGGRNAILDFALRGSGTAWRESSAAASRRVERRVFGWWFAWPWAFIEASAESVVRTGLGIPGGAAISVGGAVATPVVYLAGPAVMGTVHAAGEGTLVPVAAGAWNTVIAPPLALTGQQPAPERADGFWMKRLRDPAEDDIRVVLAAWRGGWESSSGLAARRAEADTARTRHEAELARLREAVERENRAWAAEGEALEAAWREQALAQALQAVPGLRAALAERGYTPERLRPQRDMLRETLVAGGLDGPGADRVLDGLLGVDRDAGAPVRAADEKTDPVRQVLERAPLP